MLRQDLNRQWNFKSPGLPSGMVDLPHDYSIIQEMDPDTPAGASNGFFPGGVAEYEKSLFAPMDWEGKKVILEFEGVYMNTTVRLNGHIVAKQPYGYTSFHCDLTPYLMYSKENIIQVYVNNNALPNTRWYSGSGIYRPVWLMLGDNLHIKPWGIFATTPEVSVQASMVLVRTDVENSHKEPQTAIIRSTLLDNCGAIVSVSDTTIQIPGNSSTEAVQTLTAAPARLWSVEDPCLYTIKSEIIKDGKVIDCCETPIGIRSLSFDIKNGFLLNGVSTKLKGGNVHHDCGILGAASYYRAEERKVELLKASGFNAIRCAHNPPSPSFLDACDRLGMLVMDEAFDCWRESKNPNDYNMYFDDWWERDMASMILRDRNHPSIIMWSTGNEIGERDGRSEGYAYAKKLADYVRSLDTTRAVTNGICWVAPLGFSPIGVDRETLPEGFDYWGEITDQFAAPLDVVGYNYEQRRYEKDSSKYPSRIICSTENFLKDSLEYWDNVDRYPNVIGDFYWTSMDYLGEAGCGGVSYEDDKIKRGQYPWHLAFCGDIDICGFKRPQSYYRDCIWGISKKPFVGVYKPENYGKKAEISAWGWQDVISSWTFPGFENKPTIVEVYSPNEEIELFLNGKSLGRKPSGKTSKYTSVFELTYEPGELLAVAYERGSEVNRTILKTTGTPAAIKLTPDRSVLKAEYGDLSYITVELLDALGNALHTVENNIYFTACGAGSLLAIGNSNPISEERYIGNTRRIYEGRALVVLRTNGEKGNIVLTAMADGIPASSITITVE